MNLFKLSYFKFNLNILKMNLVFFIIDCYRVFPRPPLCGVSHRELYDPSKAGCGNTLLNLLYIKPCSAVWIYYFTEGRKLFPFFEFC